MRRSNDDFSAPSGFGTPSAGYQEGQQDLVSTMVFGRKPENPDATPDEAEKRRRAVEAKRQYEKERSVLPPGVSAQAAESVAGTGPEAKDFALLAAAAPEVAAAQVDHWASAMGVVMKGPADTALSTYYKGTSNSGKGNGDVPFYTNLPPGASSVKGVKGIAPFEDTAGGGTVTTGGPDGAESDPRKRAIAEKVRAARSQIALGPKSNDVIAAEVNKHFEAADKDVRKLGADEADKKWLGMVAKGQLSDAAYERLTKETHEAAGQRSEAEYAQQREGIFSVAQTKGVNAALDTLQKTRMTMKGDPHNMARIEAELRHLGRSMSDPEFQVNPSAYLPQTEHDVQFFAEHGGGALPGGKDTKPDSTSPPTVLNPHDGATVQDSANKMRDETIAEHIGKAAQALTDRPAKAASSYLHMDDPTKGGLAAEYIAQNAQQFNNERTVAEKNRANLMSPRDMLDYLEAGGDSKMIERNKKSRAHRAGKYAYRSEAPGGEQ